MKRRLLVQVLRSMSLLSLLCLGTNSYVANAQARPCEGHCVCWQPDHEHCAEGAAIHLGSGTRAGDGAGAFCEYLILLPATGQTSFTVPFPAVDVLHGGYHFVSSPTIGGTLGPYWFFALVPVNDANPFRWNGAFGYTYIPLTGLYHVSAREYDPRIARWLQKTILVSKIIS